MFRETDDADSKHLAEIVNGIEPSETVIGAVSKAATPRDPFKDQEKKVKEKAEEERNHESEIHGLRMTTMKTLTWIVIGWAAAVLIITTINGCTTVKYDKTFASEGVLIALISTTPANLFGAFVIGTKWLFKEDKEPKSRSKSKSR